MDIYREVQWVPVDPVGQWVHLLHYDQQVLVDPGVLEVLVCQ